MPVGEGEGDAAVELGALGKRRRNGRGGLGLEGLDVCGGQVGVVDADEGGHLGQAPGVGVGALAVVAELRRAHLEVNALAAGGRRLAGGVHGAGAQAQGHCQHGGEPSSSSFFFALFAQFIDNFIYLF